MVLLGMIGNDVVNPLNSRSFKIAEQFVNFVRVNGVNKSHFFETYNEICIVARPIG